MFLIYSHVDKRFPSSTKVEFIFAPQRPGDNRSKETSGKCCSCTHMHVCVRACYVCPYTCVCPYIHTRTGHTCMCTHAQTHTHTHTHAHTHAHITVDNIITDIVRRSLLAEELFDLDPELKRNSYEDFLAGFDSGTHVTSFLYAYDCYTKNAYHI